MIVLTGNGTLFVLVFISTILLFVVGFSRDLEPFPKVAKSENLERRQIVLVPKVICNFFLSFFFYVYISFYDRSR